MYLPLLGDAGVALCTPAHQYPVGVVMTGGRRAAVIEWARDVDGGSSRMTTREFRYDRRPIGAMQGLDIGYSRSPAHAFPHALERLGDLLDAFR